MSKNYVETGKFCACSTHSCVTPLKEMRSNYNSEEFPHLISRLAL